MARRDPEKEEACGTTGPQTLSENPLAVMKFVRNEEFWINEARRDTCAAVSGIAIAAY